MEVLTAAISQPFPDRNPLIDVKIPDSILGSDLDCLNPPPYSQFISQPAFQPTPPPRVEKPAAIIGADAQRLEPPSFSRTITSRTRDRNPLRDIQLPNAIVAPEFQDVKPASPSPTIRSARNFNSLACPPQLLPQEWSSFMTDLEAAAAQSNGHKSYAIAIGITTSVGYVVDDGSFVWGMWHDLTLNGEKMGQQFEPEWKRENVGSVVERWNEKWTDRGVRVGLEVSYKRGN